MPVFSKKKCLLYCLCDFSTWYCYIHSRDVLIFFCFPYIRVPDSSKPRRITRFRKIPPHKSLDYSCWPCHVTLNSRSRLCDYCRSFSIPWTSDSCSTGVLTPDWKIPNLRIILIRPRHMFQIYIEIRCCLRYLNTLVVWWFRTS